MTNKIPEPLPMPPNLDGLKCHCEMLAEAIANNEDTETSKMWVIAEAMEIIYGKGILDRLKILTMDKRLDKVFPKE